MLQKKSSEETVEEEEEDDEDDDEDDEEEEETADPLDTFCEECIQDAACEALSPSTSGY